MGYERNNAIIVSGRYEAWGKELPQEWQNRHWIEIAHEKAVAIFNQPEGIHGRWALVSPVLTSPVNDVRTFLGGPDGSKEGWEASDTGDARRTEFIEWLEAQRYGDLSSPLARVEVQYGDEMNETRVVNDSDEGWRAHSSVHDTECASKGCQFGW